ncbi:probetacellulin isoform X2 [Genypterus blacodes]|uniref:probetacellulin isoform X2 n=1 Tax=Genypterus blacodes TaxID=154954 RepID=UPI003F75780F
MAEAYRVCVAVVTALALCKYSVAEWNATDEPANRTVSSCHHGNNCTDIKDTEEEWSGHFSVCPRELKHFCIHGTCRYVKEQKMPSCMCDHGFVGSRCEYVELDWQIGEQRKIIIASVITGLVLLVLLVVFICIRPQ